MAAQVDADAVADILRAVAEGDARIHGVTVTPFGLVIDADVVDEVLRKLKAKEKES